MLRRWAKPLLRAVRAGVSVPGSKRPTPPDPAVGRVDEERVRREIWRRERVDLVLDVGANQGQYGLRLREQGYDGRLISFEPQSEPFEVLTSHVSGDDAWEAFRLALGAEPGRGTMQVAANRGQSSSLLPMLPLHERHAPGARIVGRENVETTTLSGFLRDRSIDARSIFLKLDVQGYELEVLDGCDADDFERVAALEVELSSVPFYEGQPLLDDVISRLYSEGFRLTSFRPVWVDRASTFCLQADGIFVRERLFEKETAGGAS